MSSGLMPSAPSDDENTAVLVLLATGLQAVARLQSLAYALSLAPPADPEPGSPGISGYFHSGIAGQALARSASPEPVERVEPRESAAPEQPVEPAGPPAPAPIGLTPREFQILRLIADGQSNRLVSRRLFVSESTVRAHLTRLYTKFGVSNRTAAVVAARRLGLLPE